MQDLENGTTCMCVKQVTTAMARVKKCHACDNSEMQMKIEMVIVKANMHAHDIKRSQKSSRQHSHKSKHKKQHKCYKRQVKKTYPRIIELDVLKTPRCIVGCQRSKIDVKNEL